jgi:hypothetical protein
MMSHDCSHTREQFGALIDGELTADEQTLVEAHVRVCADCRAALETLESLHGQLTATLQPLRERASAVADRALARWETVPAASPPRPVTAGGLGRYLAAAAAGFLLAAILFNMPPVSRQTVTVPAPAVDSAVDGSATESVAARVVLATGPLQFQAAPTEDWQTIPVEHLANFACPSDSRVRTESAALCELVTPRGDQLRLNEQTEIALSSQDAIELVGGQLWCRTSPDKSLRLTAVDGHQAETAWTCLPGSESLATKGTAGDVRILAVTGVVEVDAQGMRHSLPAGFSCRSTEIDVIARSSADEFLVASRWMQPLLTRAGHDNPELTRRVDDLLARIGRAKLSFLYEQELRNLGEYGTLPLLRYVQGATSNTDRGRRQTAMRIVADTAPIWMAPDLIALLEDADPEVRSLAAEGLARLTRETHGLSPDDWRGDRERWQPGVASWQAWWARHGTSCSLPPAGVSPNVREQPSTIPPDLLKVRN